jgi:hypothetical protein
LPPGITTLPAGQSAPGWAVALARDGADDAAGADAATLATVLAVGVRAARMPAEIAAVAMRPTPATAAITMIERLGGAGTALGGDEGRSGGIESPTGRHAGAFGFTAPTSAVQNERTS